MIKHITNYHVTTTLPRQQAQFRLIYVYHPIQSEVVSFRSMTPPRVVDEDSTLSTMIAAEMLLAEDWDSPEDNEAWADL